MSTARLSAAADIDLSYVPQDPKVNPDYLASELHFVFWAGAAPLALDPTKVGFTQIRPFRIKTIKNFERWERDQNDYDTPGFRRHPDKVNREGEIWVTDTAGSICEYLEREFGRYGLVVLRPITGNAHLQHSALIAETLLPEITDEAGKYLPYARLKEMVQENAGKPPTAALAGLTKEVATLVLQALNSASKANLAILDIWRSELQERSKPGGAGIARLPEVAYDMLHLVERPEADYVSDVRTAGQAAAESTAAGMLAAFQQMALMMQKQAQDAAQKPTEEKKKQQ